MAKGTVYVFDDAAGEVVTKGELAKRQAAVRTSAPKRPDFLPQAAERGHWIYDRDLRKVVSAEDFYARQGERVRTFNVIGDIEPILAPGTNTVLGGRKQRRDYLRAHGLEHVGDDRLPTRKPFRPKPAGQDVKNAIEQLRAGHKPPPVGTASGSGWIDP